MEHKLTSAQVRELKPEELEPIQAENIEEAGRQELYVNATEDAEKTDMQQVENPSAAPTVSWTYADSFKDKYANMNTEFYLRGVQYRSDEKHVNYVSNLYEYDREGGLDYGLSLGGKDDAVKWRLITDGGKFYLENTTSWSTLLYGYVSYSQSGAGDQDVERVCWDQAEPVQFETCTLADGSEKEGVHVRFESLKNAGFWYFMYFVDLDAWNVDKGWQAMVHMGTTKGTCLEVEEVASNSQRSLEESKSSGSARLSVITLAACVWAFLLF